MLHRIQQDGSGLESADWFLQRVVVSDLRHSQWTYYFPCAQWLSRSRGDGSLVRELRGTRDPLARAHVCSYKVTLHTGDKPDCACDCDVLCTLSGREGDSGERLFVPEKKSFLRGRYISLPFSKSITPHISRGSCIFQILIFC